MRNSHAMTQNKLFDYCDGVIFKKNQLFIEDPSALQIQLYCDELELCNPLGSKAKKHKLGKYSIVINVDGSIACIYTGLLYFGKS